jgi:predicted metal-dependent phosphoesterase TrpH
LSPPGAATANGASNQKKRNKPMRFIDLHTHSTASDGARRPAGIIDQARAIGLAAVALTDHDTVAGLPEFLGHAASFDDITAVPGVEISVDLMEAEAHIVGLFIDHQHQGLLDLLTEIRANRDQRNRVIIDNLRAAGYQITIEEILAEAGGDSVGRPHFAKVLVAKGYFSDPQQVFDRCLKRGQPGYCPRILPEPGSAIGLIHAAGGLAIWAHAAHRRKNDSAHVRKTLAILLGHGIDGLETIYTTFDPAQTEMMRALAAQHQLLESGGSDYHGENQPTVALGVGFGGLKVPETFLGQLQQAWRDRKPR